MLEDIENKDRPVTVKPMLKPCPNPSCKKSMPAVGGFKILCNTCGTSGPTHINISDAVDAWNALPRAPQWTTYDGTPETLPENGGRVLVSLVMKDGSRINMLAGSTGKGWREGRVARWPYNIGDRWMYWPKEDDNDA